MIGERPAGLRGDARGRESDGERKASGGFDELGGRRDVSVDEVGSGHVPEQVNGLLRGEHVERHADALGAVAQCGSVQRGAAGDQHDGARRAGDERDDLFGFGCVVEDDDVPSAAEVLVEQGLPLHQPAGNLACGYVEEPEKGVQHGGWVGRRVVGVVPAEVGVEDALDTCRVE